MTEEPPAKKASHATDNKDNCNRDPRNGPRGKCITIHGPPSIIVIWLLCYIACNRTRLAGIRGFTAYTIRGASDFHTAFITIICTLKTFSARVIVSRKASLACCRPEVPHRSHPVSHKGQEPCLSTACKLAHFVHFPS